MSAAQPYLSIVIPSYNEEKNIRRGVLEELTRFLSLQEYSWEVVFTDDGSRDSTVSLLKKFIAAQHHGSWEIIENVHAGKGPTVQSGMLAARGKWRLFTDFDQSTPLSEVTQLLSFAENGYDVVIGSREIRGAQRKREPLHRHLMGRGFNLLVQLLAIPGILDTQCGFKLFSDEAAERLFTNMSVYGRKEERADAFTGAFDVELLFLARKFGYTIKEVPIHWQHHETDRVSPVKDSLRMLRDIFRVRIAELTGAYRTP